MVDYRTCSVPTRWTNLNGGYFLSIMGLSSVQKGDTIRIFTVNKTKYDVLGCHSEHNILFSEFLKGCKDCKISKNFFSAVFVCKKLRIVVILGVRCFELSDMPQNQFAAIFELSFLHSFDVFPLV